MLLPCLQRQSTWVVILYPLWSCAVATHCLLSLSPTHGYHYPGWGRHHLWLATRSQGYQWCPLEGSFFLSFSCCNLWLLGLGETWMYFGHQDGIIFPVDQCNEFCWKWVFPSLLKAELTIVPPPPQKFCHRTQNAPNMALVGVWVVQSTLLPPPSNWALPVCFCSWLD